MDQLLFPLLEVTHNHTAQGNGVPQLGVTSGGPNHPGFLGSDNSQNTPRVGLCEQDSVRRLFSCIPSFPFSTMLMKVAQSCPTLCDPMDCILPGFSVYGILQARILECKQSKLQLKQTNFLEGTARVVHGFSKSCKDNRGFPGGARGKEPASQGRRQKLRD